MSGPHVHVWNREGRCPCGADWLSTVPVAKDELRVCVMGDEVVIGFSEDEWFTLDAANAMSAASAIAEAAASILSRGN